MIVTFMLGFVPIWIVFRDSSNRLSAATHELNLARAECPHICSGGRAAGRL
jgi:hypothetical protein